MERPRGRDNRSEEMIAAVENYRRTFDAILQLRGIPSAEELGTKRQIPHLVLLSTAIDRDTELYSCLGGNPERDSRLKIFALDMQNNKVFIRVHLFEPANSDVPKKKVSFEFHIGKGEILLPLPATQSDKKVPIDIINGLTTLMEDKFRNNDRSVVIVTSRPLNFNEDNFPKEFK